MEYALYLNGVYESGLEEIQKAQSTDQKMVCYLQPYSSDTIVKLSESLPDLSSPITIYISTTSSLPFVSYRAKIVGWENKTELSSSRRAELNAHIQQNQPGETEIYKVGGNGKPCVNLISVVNMERLSTPIPVSSFIKISDKTPLKPRTTSGGWSYVQPIPDWVGTITQTAVQEESGKEFEQKVKESYSKSETERTKRLELSPKLPEVMQVISRGFRRNPDVVAAVLHRAKGKCDNCGKDAPFIRSSDGTPYLEVHHKVMLSEGGEDAVDNAIAVCPNCHRELHFGA